MSSVFWWTVRINVISLPIATDHLGMRIASRDALAPTKDISCLSIWWRDWFRSDPIAVRYLVRISKVWYKYHGVFSLRISNSIPTPLLQLPTICRVLIVLLLLLRSQSSSGDAPPAKRARQITKDRRLAHLVEAYDDQDLVSHLDMLRNVMAEDWNVILIFVNYSIDGIDFS